MKAKLKIYSKDSIKALCERVEKAVAKLEESENKSLAKSLWDGLTKKPVFNKKKR